MRVLVSKKNERNENQASNLENLSKTYDENRKERSGLATGHVLHICLHASSLSPKEINSGHVNYD